MGNEIEQKKVDELWGWLWKKENVRSNLLLPFGVTILMLIVSLLSNKDSFVSNLTQNLLSFIFEFVLVFLVINIPRFLLDKLSVVSRDMADYMNNTKDEISLKVEIMENVLKERIDKLPQLLVFHTERNVFENRLKELYNLNSSPRWIYSKYISKILYTSFKEFKIKFSETAQYSDFSSEIMRECTKSVCLTSSMTPYEWLSSLALENDKRTQFFNNVSEDIDLNPSNHSMILRKLPIDKKHRVVCLEPFDFDHLFLFERSFKKYLEKNDGIKTEFYKWNKKRQDMLPLQYEYALYDGALLFKFEKGTKELEVLKDKEEFQAVKNFFEDGTSFECADTMLTIISEKKQTLLTDIQSSEYQLPHKYAYLFHDKWKPFVRETLRFGQNARNAIADLIDRFDNHFSSGEELVEIGAGYGDKIDLVCDRIGTDKIASYYLVDISRPLMNDTYNLLKKRFDGKQTPSGNSIQIKEIQFDFCGNYAKENREYANIVTNKTVLILNNSTLFCELNFPWEKLKQCKKAIVTLDLFEEDKASYIFEEYYKARELFTSPLKIFGIPIVKELVDGNNKEYEKLFTDNSADSAYSNDNPYYKIYFNLKEYMRQIAIKYPHLVKNNEETTPVYNDFLGQEKIVVLSSLKFKSSNDLDDLKEKVKSYFLAKFGKSWEVSVEKTDHSDDSYIGVCIEKKSNK